MSLHAFNSLGLSISTTMIGMRAITIALDTNLISSSAVVRLLQRAKVKEHRKKGIQVRMSSDAVSSDIDRYEGKEPDLQDCISWLAGFPGGSVKLTKDESSGIAQICLDRPNKKNAMSGEMMVQLGQAVAELEEWSEGKGLILRGTGAMLCSGGDLDFARASAGAETAFKMSCYMHNILGRLKALPMISAALIHGQGALGGGAEISVACDWRLMTNDCRGIGFVHTRMGIVPAWSGSTRLANIVGSHHALDLICSSRIIPPEEALKMGLVDYLVQPGESDAGLSDALSWMSKRTQAEAHVVRAAKATLLQYELSTCQSHALSEERKIFAPLWGGPANQHALNSHIKHL